MRKKTGRKSRRARKVSPKFLLGDKKQQVLIAQWALTALIELRGWKKLGGRHNEFTDDRDILAAIGLEELEGEELDKEQFFAALEEQRENLAGEAAAPNQHLQRNSQEIADYIGLNDTERDILRFTVLLKGNEGLQNIMELLGNVGVESIIYILATILDLDHQETRSAISRQSLLSKSGLLSIDRDGTCGIELRLDLLEGLGEALQEAEITAETLLQNYFNPVGPPELTEKNYLYVKDNFAMIRDHLKQAGKQRKKGVNILLYGPPGTGKTEFAKTVARDLGSKLFGVNIGDEDRPFDKAKRIRAFQLAQQVLSRQKEALLLFDEIDSLLVEGFSFLLDGQSLNLKASVNQILEENPVPAIWIANDIFFAESAFIRRFDIVLNLKVPPRSTRLEILENYFKGIAITPEWLGLLADNKHTAPAVIARAARVVRDQKQKDPAENEKRLEKLLESTQIAMGYPCKSLINAHPQITYRLDAVNPDQDLKGIVQGLRQHGEGRLCLYGPPGTGKTEFGHYLARELDKPLLIKRSSDLLSKYIGETETNIANMFYEAEYEKSVLLLDEADSFLRDRQKARQRWEITQVNELLTQMERHQGIFVCSTNLMDDLDAASLRRFDLKIKFDFLKTEQAWELFQAIFTEKGVALSGKEHWRGELKKYKSLTPGDFATVVRKSRISGVKLSPNEMLAGLAGEVAFKDSESGKNIGFAAL